MGGKKSLTPTLCFTSIARQDVHISLGFGRIKCVGHEVYASHDKELPAHIVLGRAEVPSGLCTPLSDYSISAFRCLTRKGTHAEVYWRSMAE